MFEFDNKKKDLPPSCILANMTIKGDIIGEGSIEIDGVVEGDISVSRIVLGKDSMVKGTVESELVVVHGEVLGAIKSTNVQLMQTSRVYGDIFHEFISIESGAVIHGRCVNSKEGETEVKVTEAASELTYALQHNS